MKKFTILTKNFSNCSTETIDNQVLALQSQGYKVIGCEKRTYTFMLGATERKNITLDKEYEPEYKKQIIDSYIELGYKPRAIKIIATDNFRSMKTIVNIQK